MDTRLRFLADRENRVLITEDKDFGALVFASHADSAGVILIRYPGNARSALGPAVVRLAEEQADQIAGAFVAVQPGQVRISKKPE